MTFDSRGKASAQLTISAGGAASLIQSSAAHGGRSWHFLWLPIVGFAIMGAGLGFGNVKSRRLVGFFVVSFLMGLLVEAGCGGSGSPKSQNYSVTVTASAGSTQHSTTVQLTVQ